MSKRSRTAAFDEGPRLRIILASAGEPVAAAPLVADAYLVRMYSAVARLLPEADEWDISGLLVDGQPVSRATVVAWLNAAYQHAYETDFEQQDDSPACSADGLYSLLAFADAVDSTRPLLKACCAGLQQLHLHAQLGQQQVALQTDGRVYILTSSGVLWEQQGFTKSPDQVPGAPAVASAEQQAAFKQQVAAQAEQLLWLAYRLQLEPLMQRLHGCLRSCVRICPCSAVFTPRVVEAAGVASLPGGKAMLMNSALGETAQLTDTAASAETWLQPQFISQAQRKPLKFDAVVKRSGLGVAEGSTVPVELDLFGESKIRLGQRSYAVQLRIGNRCS